MISKTASAHGSDCASQLAGEHCRREIQVAILKGEDEPEREKRQSYCSADMFGSKGVVGRTQSAPEEDCSRWVVLENGEPPPTRQTENKESRRSKSTEY